MSQTHPPVCRHDQAEIVPLPWGHVAFTVSRRIGNSTSMTFGTSKMLPHHHPTRHRHPNCDEILHVISGRIEHSLGDELYELAPGDTISIPAGVWHGARVLGDAPAEMAICFSSPDRQTEFEGTLPV